MGVKRYNLIKNIYIASLTASQYYGFVVEAIPIYAKWIATGCVFGLMLSLLNHADKWMLKKYKERNQKVVPTMTKSA